MTTLSMPSCPICGAELHVRPSKGRKSGKLFIMWICPVDGRHFRGFITDQQYVKEVMDRVEESGFQDKGAIK